MESCHFFGPPGEFPRKTWVARGRAKAPGRGKLEMTLGLPTFVGNDMTALLAAARANLGLYATLPFFRRLFQVSGFIAEAEKARQGAGPGSLSDKFLDAVCLIGPASRCRERLAAFTAAGLDLPILVPPVGVDGARAVINTFKSEPPRGSAAAWLTRNRAGVRARRAPSGGSSAGRYGGEVGRHLALLTGVGNRM